MVKVYLYATVAVKDNFLKAYRG
uniref:Uncharacterized protein n=1 Tax=Anguilla anguilla TaxID=7936 RepID=A0A0E9Q2G5_ANGAN